MLAALHSGQLGYCLDFCDYPHYPVGACRCSPEFSFYLVLGHEGLSGSPCGLKAWCLSQTRDASSFDRLCSFR